MGNKQHKSELLQPNTILKAVSGESDAMENVINHYEKHIRVNLIYQSRKQGINILHMPLADMEQEVRIHLINAVKKFKP